MGDDVVHLAGDTAALVGRGEKRLLLPGQRQAHGAHPHLLQLNLLDPQEHADQGADDADEAGDEVDESRLRDG